MPSDAAIILVSESDNAYYAHSANGAGIRGTVWVAGGLQGLSLRQRR